MSTKSKDLNNAGIIDYKNFRLEKMPVNGITSQWFCETNTKLQIEIIPLRYANGFSFSLMPEIRYWSINDTFRLHYIYFSSRKIELSYENFTFNNKTTIDSFLHAFHLTTDCIDTTVATMTPLNMSPKKTIYHISLYVPQYQIQNEIDLYFDKKEHLLAIYFHLLN